MNFLFNFAAIFEISPSVRRGWELIQLYCGSFSPNVEFYPYLLHFLMITVPSKKNTSSEIAKLSVKCGNMVKSLMRGGSRMSLPNIQEWENIANHIPQVIEVQFPDKSSKKLEILATDKVRNLMQILSEKLFRDNVNEVEEYVIMIANPSHGMC
jgi:hypothetical protein